jgi:antitoxin component of MazEF toxin-antitoxin module
MKTKKKRRLRVVNDGDTIELTVRRTANGVVANLPRKVLRYMHVNAGDRFYVTACGGTLTVRPSMSLEDEITSYVSHK